MSAAGAVRLAAVGDTALLIELGQVIDEAVNARVLALDAAIRAAPPAGIVEIVPTYRSLLIHLDPLVTDAETLGSALLPLTQNVPAQAPAGRRWTVPVAYGGLHGIDLAAVAARHGLTEAQVIARHTGPAYRVFMIGFMPGFTYLGGLDPGLHTPRRDDPRLKTPAGSISIGGAQAAVASVEAPSGWHLLGRTPVRAFDPAREPPFLFAAGDQIRFTPIPAEAYAQLAARAAAHEPLITPEPAA